MTGPISSSDDAKNSSWGLILLCFFLALDGLTSTFQEKLFKEHKTSKYNQMFYVNFFSAFTSLSALIASGELMPSLAFCVQHPTFLKDSAILSASATTSQYFIYSQVKEFGALVFAATMNVRQVASILVSYSYYHHMITLQQAGGLLLVFAALFYKSFVGLTRDKSEETKLIDKPS